MADFTFDEIRQAVQEAVEDTLGVDALPNAYVWIQDLGADWAVYNADGVADDAEGLWRVGYTMGDDGKVTLNGAPEKVKVDYTLVTEAVDTIGGRVSEALGTDEAGGRVYRVQIIEHGTSKNGNRYPASVLTEAVSLYEGAKAFDHHRTEAELRSSTVVGLVGRYKDVAVNLSGLEGELHLLPSATHTAEAFDESLRAQAEGQQPLVGISHDVQAAYRTVSEGSGRIKEATKINRVLSADVVADPAAGGRVTRMVAGGTGDLSEEDTTMNLQQLLALLRDADSAKRAELLKEHKDLITEWGLDDAAVNRLADALNKPAEDDSKAKADADAKAAADAAAASDAKDPEFAKDSILGKQLVKAAVADGLGDVDAEKATESILKRLGERFTEADVVALVGSFADSVRLLEADGLAPKIGHADVGKEDHDKLVERLDKFFAGNFSEGFHSFKQAFIAFTGANPYSDTEDFNRLVLRESFGSAYDSRMTESATSSTWSKVLGDSVTRRLVAEYNIPDLQDWRQICSSIVPVNDFRTQRVDRVGGYGTLPTVLEGAPYQPLTTPSDEEATYSLSKKGGTEDLTIEVIANDDVRWISRIPSRLALSAGRTLHDAIWGILSANAACSYDSVALFNAGHSNTTAVALSYANYVALRALMRRQAGFGDSVNLLDIKPKFLIVPPELEGTADQLCRGEYAPPATSPGATNVPNLAQGTVPIVKPFLSDTNDWFLIGDPNMVPTIEVGFYQGREDPELFTQADATVGSMFNADKMTMKIRHIWSFAVLDHRGFQRATQ